jgi:hypothetical protein
MSNALNLKEIDQEQALNLSKFFIRSEQNLFLFGRRGVGKTHIAFQAAKECKVKVNYINLSVIERPDLAGYPDIHSSGDIVTFKSPQFLPKLLEASKADSIILFDEVDKAPPEVTAPLLEILQFRKINGVNINAACCILTGNLMNEGAYSNQISSALLDRGAKYILSFNFDKWIDWAKANDVNDLILGFLKNTPELACGKIEESCYANPSPRGWTQASEALMKAKQLKLVDIDSITQIISGFVGNESGLRFQIWYENFRKFEPYVHSLIESGSMAFDFNGLTPSEQLIFCISACYHAKTKIVQVNNKSKNKFVYLENLCKFFSSYEMGEEIKVMGLNNSFDFNMITKLKLYECKEFFDLFNIITEKVQFKK